MIFRLIYMSTCRSVPTPDALEALMLQARENNLRDDITGLTAYHDHTFIQILEGEHEKVMACFDRICDNPMHHNVLVALEDYVETRSFAQYSMAFVPIDGASAPRSAAFTNLREMFSTKANDPVNSDAIVSGFLSAFKDGLRKI